MVLTNSMSRTPTSFNSKHSPSGVLPLINTRDISTVFSQANKHRVKQTYYLVHLSKHTVKNSRITHMHKTYSYNYNNTNQWNTQFSKLILNFCCLLHVMNLLGHEFVNALQYEIMWNANLMQRGNFIDVFLALHVSGTYAHHQEH